MENASAIQEHLQPRGPFCQSEPGTSPHFSHSMWPAPVQEADRAGAARSAMWDIGQARRRTLSASSTGPLGCLSAGISSVGSYRQILVTEGVRRQRLELAI